MAAQAHPHSYKHGHTPSQASAMPVVAPAPVPAIPASTVLPLALVSTDKKTGVIDGMWIKKATVENPLATPPITAIPPHVDVTDPSMMLAFSGAKIKDPFFTHLPGYQLGIPLFVRNGTEKSHENDHWQDGSLEWLPRTFWPQRVSDHWVSDEVHRLILAISKAHIVWRPH
jgi:hypothetical protein